MGVRWCRWRRKDFCRRGWGKSAAFAEGVRRTRLNSGDIQDGGAQKTSAGRCEISRSRDAARTTAPGVSYKSERE